MCSVKMSGLTRCSIAGKVWETLVERVPSKRSQCEGNVPKFHCLTIPHPHRPRTTKRPSCRPANRLIRNRRNNTARCELSLPARYDSAIRRQVWDPVYLNISHYVLSIGRHRADRSSSSRHTIWLRAASIARLSSRRQEFSSELFQLERSTTSLTE